MQVEQDECLEGGLPKGCGYQARLERTRSDSEDLGLLDELARSNVRRKASVRSGVRMDASKVQIQERTVWQVLNLEKTLSFWDEMAELPSVENLVCILLKCRKEKDLACAKRVHAHICKNGLESHSDVGNYIVPMFVECGSLIDAQLVFNRLVDRNEYSWTSLILGYLQCGQLQHAFRLYQKMLEDSVHPSSFTLLPLVKACAMLKDVEKGRDIHVEIAKKGFEREMVFGNTLVSMYGKCGSLLEAQEVFDQLPVQEVVAWTALIAGYAEHGPSHEALKCFEQMQLEGMRPNAFTFVCVLKACRSTGAIEMHQEIHAVITQKGFDGNPVVGNALVDMYAKCGFLVEAQEAFDKLPVRDIVSWTSLIAGYAEHGHGWKALACFEQMQLDDVSPDTVTFLCILKACGNIGAIDKCRETHKKITAKGFERHPLVGNTLVDVYAKCGSLSEALEAFYNLPTRNVVSWNALIAGYAEHGPHQEVLKCFERMQLECISANSVTFVWLLKACCCSGSLHNGREIHAKITQYGFESDLFVGSTLVDMYTKCGSLSEAQKVFDKLPVREVVPWTALIAGYVEHGPGLQALKQFEQMQQEGVSPNPVTFAYVLKACGSITAIDKGRELHTEITQMGLERDPLVGNTLVDMYAKCGSLSEAQQVFDKQPVQEVVSWTSLIAGYAMNHEDHIVLQCIRDMQEQGVKPNAVTFTCLLTTCSRASLLLKGQEYFDLMSKEYGIPPTRDHYTCVIDLLARSGHLCEAEKFLKTLPCPLSEGMWRALMSHCKRYAEADVGLECFWQLVQMNPEDASSYVLMAGIYASVGKWEDACGIEDLRKLAGAKKKPASALIEVNKEVHEFVVGDNQSKEISSRLEILSFRMEEKGHVPNLDLVLRTSSDDENRTAR